MEVRSPIEILGAIVDEVEGLRRIDARSHLPAGLLREARVALEVVAPPGEKPRSMMLLDVDSIVGRVVSHVFTDLRQGSMAFVCADGAFLILDVEGDRYEEADIFVVRSQYGGSHLSGYLKDDDLVTLGMLTLEQKRANENAAKLRDAKLALERAESQAAAARLLVKTLESPPSPAG